MQVLTKSLIRKSVLIRLFILQFNLNETNFLAALCQQEGRFGQSYKIFPGVAM